MAPLIPSAKATLSCPLYACDFDPLDSSRLVVGGGGGAGRSGVGNKITILDASKPSELREVGEIDLSKEEDSVMSLAVGQRKGKTTPVYAGVNSNPAQGRNQHFRVFGVEAVANKGKAAEVQGSKISEVSRTPLFTGTEKELYQRITRLSKPFPNQPQLGAVATGLAKAAEIVLFDTSSTSAPKSRGALQSNKEALAVDFIQTGVDQYSFAYTNEHDVYVKKITSVPDSEEPECVYETPFATSVEKPTVPKFRNMRWLTKDLLLMLTNIHSNGGVVLQILRLPPSGKGKCRIVQSHRLPSGVKKATGLAVCNLTPPLSPTDGQGYTQFVIAVGHDSNISLFKTDLQVESSVSMISKISPFKTLNKVHPLQITDLTFSNFTPPAHPITASTPPQYLKLASVAISNTVIVHTLPLFPVPLSMKKGQSKTPRYVVALPSAAAAVGGSILLSIMGAIFVAIFVQGVLEIRGDIQPWLHAHNYIPITWQERIGKPYVFPSDYKASPTTTTEEAVPPPSPAISISSDAAAPSSEPTLLSELFSSLQSDPNNVGGTLMLKDTSNSVQAVLHDEEAEGPHGGTAWEELGHEQKAAWKRRLADAGHWAEDMGETILKGVVFGELAGAVGQAVGGG